MLNILSSEHRYISVGQRSGGKVQMINLINIGFPELSPGRWYFRAVEKNASFLPFYHLLQKTTKKSLFRVVKDSLAFELGLATTLALLGIAASFVGKAYGQVGQGLPLAASGLAVVMGLNLLECLLLEET
ncbi:hypothetical protein POM88_041155 [Heracleum sosnowskyi]|uniref:Ycf20 n=1 Tax=Heracleum sosnowskyi TaxID=360622 RepID=A0AAD8HFV7_9APIA|nr:hypothetical protein POM88_041155 [Heracleum sosnowskyi]